MLGVLLPIADVNHIHLTLQHPCQLYVVLDGHAVFLTAADQDFQRKALPQSLLQSIKQLHQDASPAMHVPAVFIGALVCQGGQEFPDGDAAICAVLGKHFKTQRLHPAGIVHEIINLKLNVPFDCMYIVSEVPSGNNKNRSDQSFCFCLE